MKLEKKLDKILDILYDKHGLIFKEVSANDILIFGKKKYNLKSDLDWYKDNNIYLIMKILEDDGYIRINQTDSKNKKRSTNPTYSLTTKGIMLKRNGGFVRKKIFESLKQVLIIFGLIVTLIVGIFSSYDFIEKHFYNLPATTTTKMNTCPYSEKDKKNKQENTPPQKNIRVKIVKPVPVSHNL